MKIETNIIDGIAAIVDISKVNMNRSKSSKQVGLSRRLRL